MADLSVTGEVVVTSEKAEAAFDRVGDKATQMANEVASSAGKAGQAVDGMGDSAEKSAEKFTRADSLMRAAIMKSTRELELLGKTASQRFEAQIDFKGLEKAKFQEAISGLQAMESALSVAKAREAEFAAQNAFSLKAAQAKELVKASEYARWWAQELEKVEAAEKRLAGQNSFIASLKSQADAIGKTKADLLEMQAAQMGVATQAAPFIAKMREAEAGVGKMEAATKRAEAGFSSMGTAVQMAGRALAAIGIGAFVREFVAMADASTNMASKLALVTGSTAELSQVQRRLFDVAQASRVGFVGLADTYTQFARSTKDLGVSQTALLDITKTISQAITISGGSAASAQAALVQLGQGFASGALRGEELNSVLEQTPRLAQAIADGLGVGIGKLREMGSNGELTAEKVLGALQKAAAGIESEFARMTPTIEQSITKITNSMTRLVGEIDKGVGATSKLSSALGLVSGGIDFLAGDISKLNSQGALRAAADEVLRLDGMAKRLRNTMDSGIVGPNAQANLNALMAKLAEAKARFRELDAQLGGAGKDPRDQSGYTTRSQSYANEAKRLEGVQAAMGKVLGNLSGVKDSFFKDLNALYAGYQNGLIKTAEYQQAVANLIRDSGSIKPSAGGKGGDPFAADRDAAQEWARYMKDFSKAAQDASADADNLTKSQEKLIEFLLSPAYQNASEPMRQLALQSAYAAINQEQANVATKEAAKAAAESSKVLSAWYEVREKESQGLQNQINARREEASMMGMTTEAVVAYTQAKYEQQAAEKEAYAAALESASFYAGEYAEAYRTAAEAARQQAAQLRELGGLEVEKVNKEAAKKAKDEWQLAADDINRSLTDALLRGFESGKDFAENLRDTLKNMFSTLVLRPIISAVMSPVSMAINGVVNSMGMGAASSMGTSLLGNIGSSALISGLGSSIAGAVGSSLGAIFGSGVGNVALGTTLGLGASSSTAAALAAAQAGGAATGGIASAGSLFSGIGAAMPWIGGIAALASILGGLDDSGTYHTGGAAQYSGARGLRTSLGPEDKDQFGIGMGWFRRGDQTISAVSAIAQGLGTALDGVAVAFGQTAGYEIATAFADDTSKDGAWGALRISKDGQELLNWQDTQTSRWAPKEFGDGEEGYRQYLAAVAQDTRQVLLDMDLPSWADEMLERIGDSASMEQLTGVLNQIGVVQSAFVALGKSMEMFADLTDEMQSGLLDAAGSIEALTAGAGAFYQGFYSEQERIDAVVAQLNETLAGLDLSIDPRMGDDAKAQFRAAVEAAFAAGDAELAAALLAISGNFASAADYFEQLSDTAAQAAQQALETARGDALSNLRRAIDRDRTALQDQASTLQDTISGISSAVDMLRSNAADLYGTVQSTAQQLAAQGMVYVEQALAGVQAGGSVLDYTGLESAIGAARSGIASGTYASQFERERDALVLAGQLSQLGDLSDLQLSVEERQLKAINDQIDYLDSLNDRAQDLVDGTAALTESVDTYFQRLLKLLEPEEPAPGTTTRPPSSSVFVSGPSGASTPNGYDPIAEIKAYYDQTLDPDKLRTMMWLRGWSLEDMAAAADKTVDFARDYLGLPKFAVGTNYVPRDMPAIVHEGEAIIPKAFNPWANGGGSVGGGNSELIAEVRALRQEVAALRASGQAIAENTSGTPQMVRQFDQVTQGGNAIRNKALA